MIFPLLSGLAFLSGITLGTLTSLNIPNEVFLLPLALLLFKKKALSVVLLVFLLGFFRVNLYEIQVLHTSLSEGSQEVEGVLASDPDRREGEQILLLETSQGKIQVHTSPYLHFQYGDFLKLKGKVELTSALLEPEELSYRHYLESKGIVALVYRAELVSHQTGESSFFRSLYAFKARLETYLFRLFPEPEASFADGLLLGSRRGIPEDLTSAFQKVGLYHIVAISGSNISLLIAVFFALFSFLSFKRRVMISVFCIFVFILLVGASSTVIRAGLMGSLTLWGLYFGRKSVALFALFWSLIFLVMWNPYMLLYDIGFQLSVASTFGLLTVQPILKERLGMIFNKLPEWSVPLQEAFWLSLSAQITTLPFMAYYFGRLSWISPFVNVLATPFIPLAMFFSALTLLCPLGFPFAWASLFFIEKIALWSAQIPWVEFNVPFSLNAFLFALFLEIFVLLQFYKSKWIRAFFRDRKGSLLKE